MDNRIRKESLHGLEPRFAFTQVDSLESGTPVVVSTPDYEADESSGSRSSLTRKRVQETRYNLDVGVQAGDRDNVLEQKARRTIFRSYSLGYNRPTAP